MLRHRYLFLWAAMLIANAANAQVRFTTPLPGAIIQVRDSFALLPVHATLPADITSIELHLGSDFDTTSPMLGWFSVAIHGGRIDTELQIPKSPHHYTLGWRAHGNSDTTAVIGELTPGHIFGIAGQSNAEGTTWEMIELPDGDIRMLHNLTSWQAAHEPTGNAGGGPWIAMANELWKTLKDTLPIGIVNVAVGATGLTVPGPAGRWIRNPDQPEDGSIYGNAVARFRAAGSRLECLCWIQGESDASYCPNPQVYRDAFRTLMEGFRTDLQDTFPIFHLQISGYSQDNASPQFYAQVREAERVLPPSTYVGTAVGRSLERSDKIHFSVPTCFAVGHIFANAILSVLHGIPTTAYPPVLADTVCYLDSLSDGSIPGRYCFAVMFSRSGRPAELHAVHGNQLFSITRDGLDFDTTAVWYRIVKPGKVLVGLRNDSITKNHDWQLSYVATAGAESAPIAAISDNDTLFAPAFYKIPVLFTAPPLAGVQKFRVIRAAPNPSAETVHCTILSAAPQQLHIEIRDASGALIAAQTLFATEGLVDIPVSTHGLAQGAYWIVLRSSEQQAVEKTVVLH